MRNEHMSEALDYYRATMPDTVREAARLALASLWDGPLYIDAEGEPCSCFDEGARPFSFKAACEIVGAWADEHVCDVLDSWFCEDPDTGEEWEESITVADSGDVTRALFGELARYL